MHWEKQNFFLWFPANHVLIMRKNWMDPAKGHPIDYKAYNLQSCWVHVRQEKTKDMFQIKRLKEREALYDWSDTKEEKEIYWHFWQNYFKKGKKKKK